MKTREKIGRETLGKKGYGMIMNTTRRRKSFRSGKISFVFGEHSLEVRMHIGCLNCMNRMELINNTRVAFPEEIFHAMGTDDLRRTSCETLEVIPLFLLLEYLMVDSLNSIMMGPKVRNHSTPSTMSQPPISMGNI
jgi:hypothetical protein